MYHWIILGVNVFSTASLFSTKPIYFQTPIWRTLETFTFDCVDDDSSSLSPLIDR